MGGVQQPRGRIIRAMRPVERHFHEPRRRRRCQVAQEADGGPSNPSQEGWGDYLTRQLNERTEKLNIMGDSMDGLQQQSQGWATDVNKYISKQKRSFVMNSVKSKFF